MIYPICTYYDHDVCARRGMWYDTDQQVLKTDDPKTGALVPFCADTQVKCIEDALNLAWTQLEPDACIIWDGIQRVMALLCVGSDCIIELYWRAYDDCIFKHVYADNILGPAASVFSVLPLPVDVISADHARAICAALYSNNDRYIQINLA